MLDIIIVILFALCIIGFFILAIYEFKRLKFESDKRVEMYDSIRNSLERIADNLDDDIE